MFWLVKHGLLQHAECQRVVNMMPDTLKNSLSLRLIRLHKRVPVDVFLHLLLVAFRNRDERIARNYATPVNHIRH